MAYRQDINPQNDASCIGNARGKARRAKRHSAHRGRQLAQADLDARVQDTEEKSSSLGYLAEDIVWWEEDDADDELDLPESHHSFDDMAKAYDHHHRFR